MPRTRICRGGKRRLGINDSGSNKQSRQQRVDGSSLKPAVAIPIPEIAAALALR
jgi:hypothetical protein